MNNTVVNAIGEPCPVPVIKAIKALQEIKEGILEVHVDNKIAVQNVLRMATNKNFSAVSQKIDKDHFVVTIEVDPKKKVISEEGHTTSENFAYYSPNTVVAISSATMGKGDERLGKILMNGFIYALSQLETLPNTILFYNGGAKIPIEGTDNAEDLKALEERGVEILTCGTCLEYYGLKNKLAVGNITNMYVIVEKLNNATKIIKP